MSNKMKKKSSYLYMHVEIHILSDYQALGSHLKKGNSVDEMFLEQNLRIFFFPQSVECNSALIPLGGNLEQRKRKITRVADLLSRV